ncbi:MAG: ABC transporter ATP-binding protein [Chlamydiia bacterium]|nr:ABC transporter ATP-binding protein [Chlamydiia bacterium]
MREKIAHRVLEGIDLSLAQGERCALVGPSGCGKSTLLHAIAGLLTPSRGKISIDGMTSHSGRKETAIIQQDYGLLPWMSVSDNIALGMRLRGFDRDRIRVRTVEILEQVGLAGFEARYPSQLSGGERQRVAIARALVLEPDLLLMDEPFSALDAITRDSLHDLLIALHARYRMAILFVTHHIEEACYLGEKIVVVGSKPGRVVSVSKNGRAGDSAFRQESAFFQLCAEVRRSLQGANLQTQEEA